MFAVAINVGLGSMTAHVEYTPDRLLVHIRDSDHRSLWRRVRQQVFNLLVTQAVASRCESETCGRFFVHQLGGAKYGQHRSIGLRFCTPECARAETQRQYRRRKAALKKEQDR